MGKKQQEQAGISMERMLCYETIGFHLPANGCHLLLFSLYSYNDAVTLTGIVWMKYV